MDSPLDQTLHYPDDPSKKSDPAPSSAQLFFLEGPHSGQLVDLSRDCTSVGRLEENDVTLASDNVSKLHATIVRRDQSYFIEDCDSTNGISINGTKLSSDASRRLYHGDNIRITEHVLLFRQRGCFQQADGASSIALDHDRIAAEVEDVLSQLEDWRKS